MEDDNNIMYKRFCSSDSVPRVGINMSCKKIHIQLTDSKPAITDAYFVGF